MGLIDELKDFYGDDYSDWIQDGGDDVIYFIQKTRDDILGELDKFFDKFLKDKKLSKEGRVAIKLLKFKNKQIVSTKFGGEK